MASGSLPPIAAAREPSFEESFIHPAISATVETGIPGLKLLLVYERDIPADPIVPQRWLEASDGRKFRAHRAAEALAHLGWAPHSEADARAAARLQVLADGAGAAVVGVDDCSLLPGDVASRFGARAPSATLLSPGTYEVTQFVFRRNAMPRPFPSMPPSLERQRVTVGPGVLRANSEHLWPERAEPPRSPQAPLAPAPPPDDFEEVFKNPVIHTRRPSGIPQVELLSVYDRAWLAEDPLVPQHWLEAGDKRFRPEQAQAALAHLGWAPGSPEAALAAARLPLWGDLGGAGVFGIDPCSEVPESVATQHRAAPPQATALEAGRFQVVQYVCRANRRPMMGNSLPVDLERQTVTVARGLLQVKTERLWSGPRAEPQAPNLPPK